MEHYITEIKIHELRHLSDISIRLSGENRQHLMITGKNGAGKTSLLQAMKTYLKAINDGKLNYLRNDYKQWLSYQNGVEILFNDTSALDALYKQGDFIIAYFPADRKTQIIRGHGVEEVKLNDTYHIDSEPGQLLHKYMVHLKTQQSYARNEGDMANVDRIQKWFDRFVEALRILLGDDSVVLKYNYKEYDFKIHETGRLPYGFDELSDGYSSVIHIVSDLILRMDQNWIFGDDLSKYDKEGIVLIDELETHLHIELQKKIMPFLIKFFPRIQFIVTTHSPYILNSVSNAKAYDLERCVELENLSAYSSDGLAEGYFGADEYSYELKEKIERYQHLTESKNLTEEERAERAELRSELKNIPWGLSREAREKFEEIEGNRL